MDAQGHCLVVSLLFSEEGENPEILQREDVHAIVTSNSGIQRWCLELLGCGSRPTGVEEPKPAGIESGELDLFERGEGVDLLGCEPRPTGGGVSTYWGGGGSPPTGVGEP